MGIIARQSILSTILLYVGSLIGYLNLLYFFPKFLTTSEIGSFRTVQDMAVLFVPIAQMGLTHSLIRFFPKMVPKGKDPSGFLTLILLLGIAGFLVFLGAFYLLKDALALYFSSNAPEIIEWFPLVLGITFLFLFYNLLTAYSHSLLNIVAPNFIKDILFRLGIAIALIMYFLDLLDFNGLMWSMLVVYGLMTVSMFLFLLFKQQFKLSLDFSFMKGGAIKDLGSFAIFSLLGTSSMLIIGKIDSLMVTGMLGTGANGIYTTLFYIAVVIELPKRAMNQISLPIVSRAFEENDIPAINALYKKTSINQLLIGMLLLIGIWINLDNIFELMPKGESFAIGKWVVIIIGIGRIFDMASGINSEIIVMSKYYRFNMVLLSLLAVAMIIFNLLLIPRYGIEGAAMGSALALVLFNLSKFIFIKVKMNIQPFQASSISILILGAVTLLGCLSLPAFDNPFLDILARSALAITIYGIGVWVLKPSPELVALIDKYLRRNR